MAAANVEDTGHEDLCEVKCYPCQQKGILENAVGMCVDCQHYLCQRCYDVHTIPVPSQNHELMGKEDMLRSRVTLKRTDECIEKCALHKDEAMKYYCIDHHQLHCGDCLFIDHRKCDQVTYIPDVAKDLGKNNEYKQAEDWLKTVNEKSTKVTEHIKQHTKTLEDSCLDTIAMIQDFRKDINNALDKLEKDIITKAESAISENIKKLEIATNTLKKAQSQLQAVFGQVGRLQSNDQNCQLYTLMMKTMKILKSLDDAIQTADRKQALVNNKITFDPDREILNTLRNLKTLGKLNLSKTLKRFEYLRDIRVKFAADHADCWITGLASLPDNKLLMTDYENGAIKMVDISEGTLISTLTLSSGPNDMAVITNNQVAVCLPNDKQIAIVHVTKANIRTIRTLPVDGISWGLASRDFKLAVALYRMNEIQILSLQGSVLHRISTDKTGSPLITQPYNVIFGRDNTTLYVSTVDYNTVVCVKFDGTVVASYKDTNLKEPRGMAVDKDGNVYVCARDSNQIFQIMSSDNTIKTVFAKNDGPVSPFAIFYNQTNQTVFVSAHRDSFTRNVVKMYKVN